MTYIGKKYKANDNSFSMNLTVVGGCRHNLAGTVNEDPKIAKIVSEPYRQEVEFMSNLYTHDFINVLYKGDVIRVMFNKENVIEEPKGITAYMDIGKMLESCFKTCEGDEKEEPSEADKLRSEITFLREELNKQKTNLKNDIATWTYQEAEKFKDLSFLEGQTIHFVKKQNPIKSREEIEEYIQVYKDVLKNFYPDEGNSNLETGIMALNWVLNKD